MDTGEVDRTQGFGRPPIGWELLDLYLTGESSPAESDEVERWLAADDGNRRVLDALRDIRYAAESRERAVDVDALWTGLHQRTSGPSHRPSLRLLRNAAGEGRRSRIYWVGRIAAVLVLGALGVHFMESPSRLTTLLGVLSRPARVFSTRSAQIAEVDLSDGTHAVLGPESRMTERTGYGESRREVDLEGAAYITVRHDVEHPFIIHTRDATTEDLGTEFAVRSYPEMPGSEVVVRAGRVEVSSREHDANAVRLDSGDAVRLSRDGRTSVEHGVDLALALGWMRGEHRFTDVPFAVVIPEVQRIYGITIRVASPEVLHHRLTVAFIDQTAREAVQTLGLAMDATVEWHDKIATFRAAAHPRVTDPHFQRVMPDSLRYRRAYDSTVSAFGKGRASSGGGDG